MQYGPEVMNNIANPRNSGVMKDADGVGQVGNPECDDVTTVYIKVKIIQLLTYHFRHSGVVQQ